jgi:ribose transport system substrate-binding protein
MKKLRFLISLVTKDNDYHREQAAAAEEVGRNLDVQVQIIYADSDPITQSQQLLDIIQSSKATEFDAIVVEPAGGTSMPQVGRAAAKARIGWVLLNREIDDIAELRKLSDAPIFSVSSDNEEVGHIQARQFAALLPAGGTVLYLQGPSASQPAQRRAAGMYQAKPANIAIKVLKCPTWTEADGYQAVASWLRLSVAHKEVIDLVAGQNDLIAIGARKALQKLLGDAERERWSKVRFIGVNGLPETGQAWVRNGALAATVVVLPNTVPALKLLVSAARDRTRPPENTLVAPYSFPKIDQLSGAS